MTRRANGEGGKPRRRADGRYECRYTDADGKQRSVYAKTSDEAIARMVSARAGGEPKSPRRATVKTLAAFLDEYQDVARATMKTRSFENVRDVIRLHLLPVLGNKKLSVLAAGDVQKLYTRKLSDGLSSARVHCIHRTLSTALNMAVRFGYVEENVCANVSPPRVPAPDVRPLTREEAIRLLKASEVERLHALYVLGLTTGARWGELTGLFWSDLDFTARRMWIERALIRTRTGYVLDSPKTKGSRRTVPLSSRAVEALQSHQERQREAGIPADGRSLVFTGETGEPLHSSNFIRRSLRQTLERAGLPRNNWHALTRHTCTCLLLLDKVDPRTVCNQLGWSSVAFMLEKYARFLPGWGDSEAMDRILGED